MTTDVTVSTVIRRPRPDVAAYMFDPRNDAEWTTGVESVTPLTPGPLREGSKVERDVRFLGRRFGYTYEVTAAEPDQRVEMAVEVPFPMRIRYELVDEGADTRASIRARGEPRGFFRLFGPLLSPMVRRSIGRDLELLRRRLERESGERGPGAG